MNTILIVFNLVELAILIGLIYLIVSENKKSAKILHKVEDNRVSKNKSLLGNLLGGHHSSDSMDWLREYDKYSDERNEKFQKELREWFEYIRTKK